MASGDLQFLRQTDCRSQTKRHKDGNLPSGVQWRMKKGCGKSLASELWVFFNALTLLTKWHVGHLAHKNQCHFSPKDSIPEKTFFSGMPHNEVLPCQRYVARVCGHWPFSRLTGSRCWLTVYHYQFLSASWYNSPRGLHQWLGGRRNAPMTQCWSCLGTNMPHAQKAKPPLE